MTRLPESAPIICQKCRRRIARYVEDVDGVDMYFCAPCAFEYEWDILHPNELMPTMEWRPPKPPSEAGS